MGADKIHYLSRHTIGLPQISAPDSTQADEINRLKPAKQLTVINELFIPAVRKTGLKIMEFKRVCVRLTGISIHLIKTQNFHYPLMQITGLSRATLRASPARSLTSTTALTSL